MIRIKIRYSNLSSKGRLLRFDSSSTSLEELLRQVAAKLDVLPTKQQQETQSQQTLSSLFQLTLEGDEVIEDVGEIESNDNLVLVRVNRNNDNNGSTVPEPATSQAATRVSAASARIVSSSSGGYQEDTENDDEEDNDNSVVEDATEFMRKTRAAARKKKQQEETISLSSDGEESDDEDDDEGSVEEGSEGWEEPSDEEEDDDSDYGEDQEKKPAALPRKNKKAPKPPKSPLEVIIQEKDVPAAPGKPVEADEDGRLDGMEESSTLVDGAGRNKADQAVKDRIIKLLNTGFHDQSNEHEAKNAMKLAQRLMRRHNLSQALLLKERDAKNNQGSGDNGEVLKGGMVTVQIVNRSTGQPAQFARWISNLCHPVSTNFGVKSYHTVRRGVSCSVTFYGIYTNSQLAGYSFKLAIERIAQMTAQHKPEESAWRYRPISTRSSRLSYSLGIVDGLEKEVDRNLELEKQKRQRKLGRARLAASKGEAYEESDNEDGDDDEGDKEGPGFSFASSGAGCASSQKTTSSNHSDGNWDAKPEEAKKTGTENAEVPTEEKENVEKEDSKPKPTEMRGGDLDKRLQELEQEEQAALVLVDHGERVAEDVLKDNGVKLLCERKRKAIQLDRSSYRKGVEDSQEIDLDQRAIRDETKVKKEE